MQRLILFPYLTMPHQDLQLFDSALYGLSARDVQNVHVAPSMRNSAPQWSLGRSGANTMDAGDDG